MKKDYTGKTILSVLAHPDDESFGMGGTLALYAKLGASVNLICATRGEMGTVAPEFLDGYSTIAELREAELRCAAEQLGLNKLIILDFCDSGMAGSEANKNPDCLWAAPLEDVTAKVVKAIRELKPDVVLTFDPVGGYHHPDHIKIHQAAVAAFHDAGDPNKFPNEGAAHQAETLYFHIFPRKLIRSIIGMLKFFGVDVKHFGRNKDLDLEMLAGDDDYPQHVTINIKSSAEEKMAASECHASQNDFGRQGPLLMRVFRKLGSGKDHFMRAYPEAPDDFHTDDLFL